MTLRPMTRFCPAIPPAAFDCAAPRPHDPRCYAVRYIQLYYTLNLCDARVMQPLPPPPPPCPPRRERKTARCPSGFRAHYFIWRRTRPGPPRTARLERGGLRGRARAEPLRERRHLAVGREVNFLQVAPFSIGIMPSPRRHCYFG
jgi:hypothetical protein